MVAFRRMRLLPKDQDWTGYIWLVYLGTFLLTPFFFATPEWQRVATVLGTLAALPMYFLGYWLTGRRVLWVAAGFTLLAMVFEPFNFGAVSLFIFAATYLARLG